jgi:hypothetical protein
MPKKPWDERCGRPEIHRILLSGPERELLLVALKEAETAANCASEVGAVVQLSPPCDTAPDFFDVVLTEAQRRMAYCAVEFLPRRNLYAVKTLRDVERALCDYKPDYDRIGDALGIDLEALWRQFYTSRGEHYPQAHLFLRPFFVNASYRSEALRLRDMDTFRKMEAVGLGKVRISKSRVYFDFAAHAYTHPDRRPIPEKLADADANALAELAL